MNPKPEIVYTVARTAWFDGRLYTEGEQLHLTKAQALAIQHRMADAERIAAPPPPSDPSGYTPS